MIKHVLAAGLIALTLPTSADAKGAKHCPPGLAKKSPACMPPGQAKKAYRADKTDSYERYDDERYAPVRVGDRVILGDQEYIVVSSGDRIVLERDDARYRLPRISDGSDYVRIGDVIVRVDAKTKAVFELIELADLILS